MPEKFTGLFSNSTIYLAIFASCGGCLIRYFEEYRIAKHINFKTMIIDVLVSCFLGYLTFWFCLESMYFSLSQCAIATCLVGNFGSRIFDIIYYIIYKRLGLSKEDIKEILIDNHSEEKPKKEKEQTNGTNP